MAVLKRIAMLIVSLIVVFAAKHFISQWNSNSKANKELDSYATGECVTMSKADQGIGNIELTKSACDIDPSYTVASRIDASGKCPNENYSEYSLSVNYETAGKLCLVENLAVDHCYETEFMTNITKLKATCTGGLANSNPFKVVSRVESEGAPCPGDSTAVTYAQPARTYCVSPLDTIG